MTLLRDFEHLLAVERRIECFGIEIRVSELCPPDQVLVVDPGALDLPDDPIRRVLVVPTAALAEEFRKVAEQVGVKVVD